MLHFPTKRTIGDRIRGRLHAAWLYNTQPTASAWRRLGSLAYPILAFGVLFRFATGDFIGGVVPLLVIAALAFLDSGSYLAENGMDRP